MKRSEMANRRMKLFRENEEMNEEIWKPVSVWREMYQRKWRG
jgi:hypothetical protein